MLGGHLEGPAYGAELRSAAGADRRDPGPEDRKRVTDVHSASKSLVSAGDSRRKSRSPIIFIETPQPAVAACFGPAEPPLFPASLIAIAAATRKKADQHPCNRRPSQSAQRIATRHGREFGRESRDLLRGRYPPSRSPPRWLERKRPARGPPPPRRCCARNQQRGVPCQPDYPATRTIWKEPIGGMRTAWQGCS